jgi:hypothetical protein
MQANNCINKISCAFVGVLIDIHTENIYYFLLFQSNSGCTNAPQCYVIRALPVLFFLYLTHT